MAFKPLDMYFKKQRSQKQQDSLEICYIRYLPILHIQHMKNYALTILFSFLFFAGRCQNANFTMDVSQLRAETVYVPIEGSPYYDDIYRLGEVYFRGERYTLFFRFNALKDRVELKDRTKRLFHMQKDAILEPTFGGRTYKYIYYYDNDELKQGYLVPLVNGTVTLYYKPKKEFIQAKSPESGYQEFSPPQYKDVSAYYLQFNKELPKPVKLSRKALLDKLNGNVKDLDKYIQVQELNLREEKDVVKLVSYYNRMEAEGWERSTF